MEPVSWVEIQRRAVRSGNWSQVRAFRDAERERLRDAGLGGEELDRTVREAVAAEFQLGEGDESASARDESEVVGGSEVGGGDVSGGEVVLEEGLPWRVPVGGGDYSVDVRWVYKNYRLVVRHRGGRAEFDWSRALTPAPSMGAVGLMEWAAENRATFFRQVVPRVFSGDAGDERGQEEEKRGRRLMAEVRESLASIDQAVAKVLARARR